MLLPLIPRTFRGERNRWGLVRDVSHPKQESYALLRSPLKVQGIRGSNRVSCEAKSKHRLIFSFYGTWNVYLKEMPNCQIQIDTKVVINTDYHNSQHVQTGLCHCNCCFFLLLFNQVKLLLFLWPHPLPRHLFPTLVCALL